LAPLPGRVFAGLQESGSLFAGPTSLPEFVTVATRVALGMPTGYAKIEVSPLGVFAHSTSGLQHAAMAIFTSYCEPTGFFRVYIVLGIHSIAMKRRPGVECGSQREDAGAGQWFFAIIQVGRPAHPAHSTSPISVRAYKIRP